jgi:hypothetical protein
MLISKAPAGPSTSFRVNRPRQRADGAGQVRAGQMRTRANTVAEFALPPRILQPGTPGVSGTRRLRTSPGKAGEISPGGFLGQMNNLEGNGEGSIAGQEVVLVFRSKKRDVAGPRAACLKLDRLNLNLLMTQECARWKDTPEPAPQPVLVS